MAKIPNRSTDLARPRSRKGTEHAQPVTKITVHSVTIPEPCETWGQVARMLWDSAQEGGVSDYYASTDWATLWLLCDSVQHWSDQGGRRSPELLRVIFAGLGSLMFTEGDRRKLRVELDRPEPTPAWEAELHLLVSDLS